MLDVDGWFAAVPARVWQRWAAYADLEPFGPLRDDERAAKVVAWVAAARGVTLRDEEVFPTLARGVELRDATEDEEAAIRQAYQAGG